MVDNSFETCVFFITYYMDNAAKATCWFSQNEYKQNTLCHATYCYVVNLNHNLSFVYLSLNDVVLKGIGSVRFTICFLMSCT